MITTPNQQEDNALSRILSRRVPMNWEVAAYIVIFLLAVFTRFHMLDARVMSHDESLHTRFAYNLYNEGNFQHTPLMHGPVLFHATAFSFYLFGDSDFTGRIYTALLGVMMVMAPLLFRRWLGKWGAILASMMLLISPLLLYYNRYIRHDTPSILFAMIMAYCILMYLDGSPRHRRRGYWLYIFAAAMILNLGSKETAFIYIAIFGSFLLMYFLARLAQQRFEIKGKPVFYAVILGIALGGMITLGMYIVVDIIPVEIVPGRGTPWADLSGLQRSSWLSWMALSVLSGLFVLVSTAVYAFRDRLNRMPRRELALIFLLALATSVSLLFIEELSHIPTATETAAPTIPDEDAGGADVAEGISGIRWAPGLALWVIAIGVAVYLIRNARRNAGEEDKLAADKNTNGGVWAFLYQFPEVDLIVLIVTLILPWTTALFIRMMGGSGGDYANLAQSLPEGILSFLSSLPNLGSATQVGQFLVGAVAFTPLAILSLVIGITWNWKRWLIAAAVFHLLFAFFFTTVFTNIAGLGTGMIYSLGYWLEQQGVRRGSQPQFYYLLVILPTYEFLPIVGSVSAMFAGITCYWKSRRQQIVKHEMILQREMDAEIAAIGADTDENAQSTAFSSEADAESSLPAPDENTSVVLLAEPGDAVGDDDKLTKLPFLLMLVWWAILNLVGYSLAGEKMPWLGTHLTLPMILISAWYFGGVFSRIDKQQFLSRGWMALLVMPVFVISLAQVIGAFVAGDPPFVGLAKPQLERSYEWLAALLAAAGTGYVLVRMLRPVSWMHLRRICAVTIFALLSMITFRAAWMASFINHDLATEFLVYAHAAPGIKWVLEDIDEMSLRLTDGKDLTFAYDDLVSWPYSWYFRDFTDADFVGGNPTLQNTENAIFVIVGSEHRGDVEPILEDRYYRNDYMRMWWPMQEYFGMTPQRIMNTLDFSPGNPEAAAIRRGIFDIWWSRDYDKYGEATGKDFSLTNWPVSDRMHVYVRKDFAAKIWEYGVGEGTVPSNIPLEVNQCAANWQLVSPTLIFDTSALRMARPLGMSLADERVYVADEEDNRVHIFTTDGQYVDSLGANGTAVFNLPNSVAAMPNGDLLVVDTWNYRIQQVTADGDMLKTWGKAGEYGFDAPVDPTDAFWGPRDVVIDDMNRAFISDTGNKRIRVYALNEDEATHLYDIGRGGSGSGELDEPSGLAIHTDGRLFVADTWNRRIAVFDTSGVHLTDFRVRGWYNTTVNRPYLALDETRDTLYITDPDGSRILAYDTAGACIGSFGENGEQGETGQFQDIGGIAVDDDGFVYVSDSGTGSILKFPPFPRE